MTLEQALLSLDAAGRIGDGGFGPDGEPCECDLCTQNREVRAALDAYYAQQEASS